MAPSVDHEVVRQLAEAPARELLPEARTAAFKN